jgi:hypothetical protein
MALAEQPRKAGTPRRIKELNSDELFVAGDLYEDEAGNVWIERGSRIPVAEIRPPRR